MQQEISLTRLFNLCTVFNNNLTAKLLSEPLFQDSIADAMTNEEDALTDDLAAEMEPYYTFEITNALALGLDCENVPAGLARPTIKMTELLASVTARGVGEERFLTLVPAHKHSAAASLGFALNGAPTLARLFAPKIK